MDHAVYTANIYWHIRYLTLDPKSPMLDAVASRGAVPPTYQHIIYNCWQSMRTQIVERHLGRGEPLVLFLRDPPALA